MRVVPLSDVRVGDEIAFAPGAISFKLLSVAKKDGLVELRFGENPFDSFPETRRVILVRRPWPSGKTEEDALKAVGVAMQRIMMIRRIDGSIAWESYLPELRKGLDAVREAIEAYDLGKPPEVVPKADDVDPRVDEACGYLGGGYA